MGRIAKSDRVKRQRWVLDGQKSRTSEGSAIEVHFVALVCFTEPLRAPQRLIESGVTGSKDGETALRSAIHL